MKESVNMMKKCGIRYLDYFIPDRWIGVEEILKLNKEHPSIKERDMEEVIRNFKETTHLQKISVFDEIESIHQIVEKMVHKMLSETGIEPDKIKYIVCGNLALMEGNISTVHYVHQKFNMKNAVILPIIQPCVSSLIAMGLANKILGNTEEEYMLILSARKCPNLKERYVGFSIMGDGISLALVGNKESKITIENWKATNNGRISIEKVKGGGVFQNVSAMQKHIMSNGTQFIGECLEQFHTSFDEIEIILNVNTNYEVWHTIYPNLLGIDQDKFFTDNINFGGHLNDVDYIRNIKDYVTARKGGSSEYNILVYGADLVQSYDLGYDCIMLHVNEGFDEQEKKKISRIATLGPAGTCSEKAAKVFAKNLGEETKVELYSTFEEAAECLQKDKTDYVIVPSAYGNLADIMFEGRCKIQLSNVFQYPTLNLVFATKCVDKEINIIASQSSPRNLIEGYLENCQLIEAKSNSDAAQMVLNHIADACITTKVCAEANSMVILQDFGSIMMGWNVFTKCKA